MDDDTKCRICLSVMTDVFMTKCGHNYWYYLLTIFDISSHNCIILHLKSCSSCPSCNQQLDGSSDIFPNPLLNKMIQRNSLQGSSLSAGLNLDQIRNEEEINDALNALNAKKMQLENDESKMKLVLFHHFLLKARDSKLLTLKAINKQLDFIDQDIKNVQERMQIELSLNPGDGKSTAEGSSRKVPETPKAKEEITSTHDTILRKPKKRPHIDSWEGDIMNVSELISPASEKRISRLSNHLDDLESNYFDFKNLDTDESGFSSQLLTCSKYSRFRTVATLQYADNFFSFASSIVSSIEFDKDDEYFATAGVTKKIKIFDFSSISENYTKSPSGFITKAKFDPRNAASDSDVDGSIDLIPKYPIKEMACSSKISCLSWNVYLKPMLLSSDYEGLVSLWDVSSGTCLSQFDEHEKRAWSVDFSEINPTQMASGGDDSKVKLWSTTQRYSTCTIETKANVCSVKFHPTNSYHIAFGSADHHVHYYDLRKHTEPLHVFQGHRKAVSYVKFLSGHQLVTASTDCSLRLWSLKDLQTDCIRSFSGHVNERNFVGLSVNSDGEFISCGSETNQVFAYHNSLSKPVASHHFGNNVDAISGVEVAEDDPSQFVSSVCWKRKTPDMLVSANSQGRVKVMQMI